MRKYFYALGGLLTVLAVFITTANAMENEGNAITLFIDGDLTASVTTHTGTVGEFLESFGLEMHALDTVAPSLGTEINSPMEIEILRAFPIYLRLDGAEELEETYARQGSFLFTFVNDLRQITGLDYIFNREDWQMRLYPGITVELTTVRRIVYEEFEDLAYKTEYTENDELIWGERMVYSEGLLGRQRSNVLAVYIGGEPSGRTTVFEEMLWQPVNARAYKGTYVPPYHALSACGELFNYSRTFIAEATAYTLDFASTGRHPDHPLFGVTASGMMAQVGVVAVDTNVIPFHTRLYIEGYGFAVAGDRGGAIRGEKVDLFFDTREETIQFGRRNIRVWILDDLDEIAEI